MEVKVFDKHSLRFAVVCGGESAEREVSLHSGHEVHKALQGEGCNATLVELKCDCVSALDGGKFDLVFIAMHGAYGEDGKIQRELAMLGLPYTGSSPKACERAFDKLMSKKMFVEAGVPTPKWCRLQQGEDIRKELQQAGLSAPLVTKPVKGGSSQGVTIVKDLQQMDVAMAEACKFDPEVLAESFVRGRELTVGMLDGKALPVIELRAAQEFYDYHAKYNDDRTQYLCPADLSEAVRDAAQKAALDACACLGIEHFGRADVMLAENGKPYVLEVNTIPGFTSHSLLPKAAQAAGLSFGQLCLKILELAWERHRSCVQKQ